MCKTNTRNHFKKLEFGHNWGSEHDPLKPECTPESGSGGGYYLMYAYSNQGHENNNYVSLINLDSFSKKFFLNSIAFITKRN